MRASIIASLFVIALLGIGLRSRVHYNSSVAHAQSPARDGRRAAEVSRATSAAPWWKSEVTGEFYSSPAAARQDALKAAARELSIQLKARIPGFRYTPTPRFLIEHRLVDEGVEEKQILDDPTAPVMVRNKLNIEVRESQMAELLDEDRRERSVDRLWKAGGGLAAIVLALVALVGYVRLDDWTKGYFSMILKLVALIVVIGGAGLLWYFLEPMTH